MNKSLRTYIAKAIEYQKEDGSISERSVIELIKVIDLYIENQDNAYDLLHANYLLMHIYSLKEDKDKTSYYAWKCIEILEPTTNSNRIFYCIDKGSLMNSASRDASYYIAKNIYDTTQDIAEIQKASKLLSVGIKNERKPIFFYMHNLLVRLLLKQNLNDKAFTIIEYCLRKDLNFNGFDDITIMPSFREWKKRRDRFSSNEREILIVAQKLTSKIKEKSKREENNQLYYNFSIPSKTQTTYGQLSDVSKKKYLISENKYSSDTIVIIYHGDLFIDGNLDKQWFSKQMPEFEDKPLGIIIEGTLFIKGNYTLEKSCINIVFMSICQNFNCDFWYASDSSTTNVGGDVDIKYAIQGENNGGDFFVEGNVNVPYIINHDLCMLYMSKYDYIGIGGILYNPKELHAHKENSTDNILADDPRRILSDSSLKNGIFDLEKLINTIRKGQNPFLSP